MLRRRPITSLLLAATVCVDLAAWAGDSLTDAGLFHLLLASLHLTEAGLLSIWLVLGRTNWWLRFSTWLAFLGISFLLDDSSGLAASNFVILAGFASLVWLALLVLAFMNIIERYPNPTGDPRQNRWQFSLAQLLAWMTYTAIVATAYQASDLRVMGEAYWLELLYIAGMVLTFSIIPVAAVLFVKGARHVWFRTAVVCAIALGVAVLIVLILELLMSEMILLYLLQAVITSLWLIAVDHDIAHERRLAARVSEGEPTS